MKKSFLTGIAMVAFVIYPAQVFAAETSTLQTQLMTYLPYILIGGAVILLISIVGILLSKKKENVEEEVIPSVVPAVENTPPTVFAPEVQTPEQPVNMDSISNNLYAPAETKPSIQETIEANISPVEEMPMAQPEFIPPVIEQTQSSDLQDILQGEASTAPMGPVTDHVMQEPPTETTISTFDASVAEPFVAPSNTSTEVAPAIPDLQQFVNNQVAEVPPMTAPIMETPAQAPVAAPMPDLNQAPVDTTTPTPPETPSLGV